jgi:PAT family beta-lactamase induction signal transducer AmpG
MLALGYSSGLPFLLTGNTLGYWLRDEGTTLQAIGFLSWVGLAYSLKFLWAPFVDRLDAPVFGRLGRRRGWMLLAQGVVAAGLFGLAFSSPSHGLALVGALALLVAFASSTQDIVVDAWRIEAASDADEMGLLSAAYQLGYRAALLTTDSLILLAASRWGWRLSYGAMAALMIVGAGASLAAVEPARAETALDSRTAPAGGGRRARGVLDAIVGPFAEFFRVYGWLALVMFAMISLYRLPDFVMGPMANPFYHDLGLSKEAVGAIRGSIGLAASLLGIAAGGLSAVRFGYLKTLTIGPDLRLFSAVMAADNFGISVAGVALVTYMSSLTSRGYTATQYALLSSTYVYVGKLAKGFSGVAVERLAAGRTLLEGYGLFFVGAALLGLPALVLLAVLSHLDARPVPAADPRRAAAS